MHQRVVAATAVLAAPGPLAVIAAVIGNGLEWYNFMLYGVFAAVIAKLFFPIAATGPALAQVIAAKAVCFRCAVRAACLAYALATGQAGIWGGTTHEERDAMGRSAGVAVSPGQ